MSLPEQIFPAVSSGKITWPSLPVWAGIQPSPGVKKRLPLTLVTHPLGFMIQSESSIHDEVIDFYSSDQYTFITPPPGTSDWGTRLGTEKFETLNHFVGNIDSARVLEIGGGNLFLAEKIIRKSSVLEYTAIDPALRLWPENVPATVIHDYFPCDRLEGQTFDLIIAHNCLEHVRDPEAFIAGIAKCLTRQGKCFLTFPEVTQQFGNGDLNVILHEHISYFDTQSVRRLFASKGLQVDYWETHRNLAKCLVSHGQDELTRHEAASLLSTAAHGFCVELKNTISRIIDLIGNGRSIGFYGATNGLNILLDALNLDAHEKISIIDSDQSKSGKFLPSSPQAISWAGDVDLNAFDSILITAGNFSSEIRHDLENTHRTERMIIEDLYRQ